MLPVISGREKPTRSQKRWFTISQRPSSETCAAAIPRFSKAAQNASDCRQNENPLSSAQPNIDRLEITRTNHTPLKERRTSPQSAKVGQNDPRPHKKLTLQ